MARIKIQKNLKSTEFIEILNKILMKNGKNKLAYRIIQKSLNIISDQTNEDALEVLEKAIRNTTPSVEIQTRRIGGAVYPIPVELNIHRGISRGVRWIVDSAKKRSGSGKTLDIQLSQEIIDASKKVGNAFRKKEEVHKIAEKNPRAQKRKKKKIEHYKNKTNSNNCFWYDFNQLEYRIDPLYYLNKKFILKQIIKLQKQNIKMVKLSEILVDGEVSGKSPHGGITRSSGRIPSITISNITKEGNICFDTDVNFVSEGFYENFQATKGKLQIGDILIVKDGATIGKTARITETYLESVFSEHIFRLRVFTHISPLYIHAFLQSELGQLQIKNLITGGAQGGITKGFSKNIYIPLINTHNQEKVAQYWQENILAMEKFKQQYNQKVEKLKNSIIEKIITVEEE
uniref:30S ribosomal protein S7 n=1 Tax=Caulerpa lentillifera TaxID=148947 RepID=A0A345HGW6_9CHLO|nr:30S ribosomal protein S7 [Caulerpa lentillifera]AXG75856.1 30S ribosomal protein S7 [Caulerpa lentillifera]QKS32248.1 30S ribosomal protein S7 [Caulerpa lentillifera]